MHQRILFLFVLFALSIFILGCSDNHKVAGGGSGSEAESVIQGQIKDSLGNPISGQGLSLRRFSTFELLDSTTTDSKGHFYFVSDQKDMLSLLAKRQNAVFNQNFVYNGQTKKNVELHPINTKKVTFSFFDGEIATEGQVVLLGLGSSCETVQGVCELDVPLRDQWVRFIPQNPDYLIQEDLLRSDATDYAINVQQTPSILICDFEDGLFQSLPGAFLGGGYGYFVLAPGQELNTGIIPESAGENISSGVIDGAGFLNSKGFNVVFTPDQWFVAGVQLIDPIQPANLSKMDSLVFDAKGEGRLTVQFHAVVEGLDPELGVYISTDIELQPEWTHYSLRPADLVDIRPSGIGVEVYTWESIASSVQFLDFGGIARVQLNLDNIKIYGLNYTSMISP
jgi:hypothetical protein